MNIKEVEKILGITRANIRYYEKIGLFTVERKENNYREYSKNDVSMLKKIIVLRKISVSVEDIRAFFKKEKTLDLILDDSIEKLQNEFENMKGSISVAKKMEAEKKADFDENFYFSLINREEKNGKRFVDLYKDIGRIGLDVIDDILKHLFFFDFKKHRQNAGVSVAIVLLLGYLIFIGPGRETNGNVLKTFAFPIIVCACVFVVCFPIMLVKQKLPGVAALCQKIMLIMGGLSILALMVVIITAAIYSWI